MFTEKLFGDPKMGNPWKQLQLPFETLIFLTF